MLKLGSEMFGGGNVGLDPDVVQAVAAQIVAVVHDGVQVGGTVVIEEALFDAEEKMEKAVSVAKDDLASIRTGRANPGMFSPIVVDYYGAPTPIPQMANINVPEARMVTTRS